ncbi:hypothetical protein GCM10010121_096590 [Streptomyces brasiliensis]|uniref:Insertion element IS402-like domain-containing protein n=1 Tax=Streptomyces brasiliensis TaxID=1954 RepID=A0A917PC74_9ACTN|nr:hypothetical protein GCM10010121_096590 [Streptomyces brasiliensis]
MPIGEYGPYPERLRQQFEGVIWRFKTGGQWREMPQEFGAWSTVHNRFRQWRDAGDSTTARAHHDAAGTHLDQDLLTALKKAAAEEEKARSKEAAPKNERDRKPKQVPSGDADDIQVVELEGDRLAGPQPGHLPRRDHQPVLGQVRGRQPQVPPHRISPSSRFAARSVPAAQASSTRVCWTWTYRIVVAIQECLKTSSIASKSSPFS